LLCSLQPQQLGSYIISVYEEYYFGEFSPTGQYSLTINNSKGNKVLDFNYYPITSSQNSDLFYYLNFSEPIFDIGMDYPDYYKINYDESAINHEIDSLFQMGLKLIQNHSDNRLNSNLDKRDILTAAQLNYKSDSIEEILLAKCDWVEKIINFSISYRLKLIPEEMTKSSYVNNRILKSETFNCLKSTYIRQENSWNKDSSFVTKRFYNFNNSLIRKSLEKYKKGQSIANYDINSATGDTIKQNQTTFPKPNERVILEYYDNKPYRKISMKANENSHVTELSIYEFSSSQNKYTLTEKRTSKYEYSPDKRIQRMTIYNYEGNPTTSTKYYYGIIK